jgi:transposase
MSDKQTNGFERVIGLDSHPDSFTAAILRGPTPIAAVVEKICNKVPLGQLQNWARKQTSEKDLFVLEASGNSFTVVRTLAAVGRQAKVLESCHLGKLKEAHANNDKISAVRIGKAYLAGTAKEVWVPDVKTQERRDLFHAHRKATKRLTQMQARLRSYLSDNGVRLGKNTRLTQSEDVEEIIRKSYPWSQRQWQLIEGLLLELRHADQQRRHWRSLIAQEVLADPQLLSLVRLCGVREMVAFGLGAFIGDIKRFDHPKKLVKYVGLNPVFDDSGDTEWSGGVGGHGNKYLRCLLVEGAQAILRCARTPLAQWGKRLLARKGVINLVVAAMARKLTVAAWYLLMGRWTPLDEIDAHLCVKVGKVMGQVTPEALKQRGLTLKLLRQQTYQSLRIGMPKADDQATSQTNLPNQPPELPKTTLYFLEEEQLTKKEKAARRAQAQRLWDLMHEFRFR